MSVQDLMTRSVQSCRPDDTLDRAAQLMWENDCGSIPVCVEDGMKRIIAVITDRDICMGAHIQGRALHEIKISDVIKDQKLRVCKTTDSVQQAESTMRQNRIRRLPVVDAQGELVGVLSLADLARAVGQSTKGGSPQVTDREVFSDLVAICSPPSSRLPA
jgi:CBS domain-containing protein